MTGKKKFLLRIDPDLHVALERWAAEELRSVNAQMEYLLADAARRAGRLGVTRKKDANSGGERER